jgi:NAD(P)H-hydrate epimerase
MLGGPAFSAIAALRSGCGLVRLALPEPLLEAGLTLAPSATGVPLPVDARGDIVPHLAAEALDRLLAECSCIAIGPGLGGGEGPRAMTLRVAAQREVPVVLDADALNNLAEIPDAHRDFHAPAVLTPHPGEYARLARALGVEGDAVDRATRPDAAERLAQRLGCVVVLKGAHTVVSDGMRTWLSPHANPALATAGTGDVLTGVVAGLVAQLFRPPPARPGGASLYDCARLAVLAHALAAERWARRAGATAGLLATDLLDELPAAAQSLRE